MSETGNGPETLAAREETRSAGRRSGGAAGGEAMRTVPSDRAKRSSRLAQIFSDTGTLFVSAKTPYDRQTLLAHASHCARRRAGNVRVQLGGQDWTIACIPPGEPQTCTACGNIVRGVVCRGGTEQLCFNCADAAFEARVRSPLASDAPAARGPAAPAVFVPPGHDVPGNIRASSRETLDLRRSGPTGPVARKPAAVVHPVRCHYCRKSFDLFSAPWCSHAVPQQSKRCPHCARCLCEHPSYVEPRFWNDAPAVFRDRGFTRLFLFYL